MPIKVSNTYFSIGLILLYMLLNQTTVWAQKVEKDTLTAAKIDLAYTKKGFQLSTQDGRFNLQLAGRLQFRFSTPGDQDPINFTETFEPSSPVFKINRARLKVGGHAYKSYLKYYFEYELARSRLLDFRIMFEKWKGFKIKIGQWKTYYTRERVISSGKQQTVDRSIINRAFTLDRQQGISLFGRHFKGQKFADFTYHFSVLTGTGIGATTNDDDQLMYVGRLQWNFLGREVSMSGSDFEFTEQPTAGITVAAVTNRSQYTRFSSSGGGQLEGFEDGVAGQYRTNQMMLETAFKYRGFSWQSEIHSKTIKDRLTSEDTTLRGNYFQAGYFLANSFEVVPEPLEVAGRIASYRPNVDVPENLEREYALAFNWFFNGHRNKLSSEVTYFNFQTPTEIEASGWRFRVQWDISF